MGKPCQFTIIFSQPKNVFHSGQPLQGQVLLKLSEPMKMRKITVLLQGRAKVHWQEYKYDGRDNKMHHYRSQEFYLHRNLLVYGNADGNSEMHPAGTYKYDFQIPLDRDLPTSYEGINGYIRYTAEATINRPWKFDHVTKTAFTVLRRLDLNTEPASLRLPVEGRKKRDASYCCSCITSGPVRVNFRINRCCFVPGEAIIVNATIENGSNEDIKGGEFDLTQTVKFYGVGNNLFSSSTPRSKTLTNVMGRRRRGKILKSEVGVWDNEPIVVPPLPPSRLDGCKCIDISYAISFTVPVPGESKIVFSKDIIIGTVPLRDIYMAAIHGAITEQPLAPPGEIGPMAITNQPTAPSMGYNTELTSITAQVIQPPSYSDTGDWDLAPPSYEEAMGQQVSILEEDDSKYTMGNHRYAPAYGYFTYNNLSSQSGATGTNHEEAHL